MFLQEKYDYYFEQGQIKKAQELAVKLLKETPPFSLEKIADLTSLSLDEIKELQKSLKTE